MIKLAPDIRERLIACGYTSYTAKVTGTMSPSTYNRIVQASASGQSVNLSLDIVSLLCLILGCQPGDILTYEEDPEEIQTLQGKWPSLGRAKAAREEAARIREQIGELQAKLDQLEC